MLLLNDSKGIGTHRTGDLILGADHIVPIDNHAIVLSSAVEREILSQLHRVPNIIVSEIATMQFIARTLQVITNLLGEDISIVPSLGENKGDSLELRELKELAYPIIESLRTSYPLNLQDSTITIPVRLQSQPLLNIEYPKNNLKSLSDAYLIRATVQSVVDGLSEKYMAGRREQETLELAMKDPLLEIGGRRALDKVIRDYQRLSFIKHKIPVSVLIIDLDHFKSVNDTYGHNTGDQILKHVSALIKQECESYFEGSHATLYRMGGEELACIVTNCHTDDALLFAENITAKLRSTPFIMNNESAIYQTASIGLATATSIHDFKNITLDDGSHAGIKILKYADLALYRAKTSRDTVVVFSPEHLTFVSTKEGERRMNPRNKN